LLISRRGQDGGLQLVRPASEITMLDVIQVLDGPLAINECLVADPKCVWASGCPMRQVWMSLQETITARLRATSMARLARRELVPAKSRSKSSIDLGGE
jgi:Rrf2 family protein